MIVELIAHTVVMGWGHMRSAGWQDHLSERGDEYDISEFPDIDADYLAEFAGRLCYQSWDRPNPATATNEGYLANIIRQQHFSVLEHASATFYVAGISRSLSHELVRHRHLSFSQVSQRYVDESEAQAILPPAIATYDPDLVMSKIVGHGMLKAHEAYTQLVSRLEELGLTRKEARQAARAVLPNATETKLVVTGNMRAWRDVIQKRNSPAADTEIRELAQRILTELRTIAPNTFQDMW